MPAFFLSPFQGEGTGILRKTRNVLMALALACSAGNVWADCASDAGDIL
ncbi:MAG: hypothetical protein LBJ59_01985 [Zoogloeaceae bacterium]|nr:hypothetical protein [Zoogloeaceae bacterium]